MARLQAQLAAYLEAEADDQRTGSLELTDTWDFGGPHLLDSLEVLSKVVDGDDQAASLSTWR